jgi:hypothetical protein
MTNTKVMDIRLDFTPHEFQCKAKAIIDAARFVVLVCHRRWGKTVFAVMELILDAMFTGKPDFRGAYIAPYRKQAKDIAWDYFKKYTKNVPGIVYNETELTVTFPNGARITLYGADNAEALRGLYFDRVVMDEVADMKPYVWGEIVRPALADRVGHCLFIGTPKGMNLFFELYNRGVDGKDGWASMVFRASDTVGKLRWITDEELDNARADLTDAQFRQEFECDFNASCDNTLITLDLIYKAKGKPLREEDYCKSPLVFGVDVARFGGDACVIQPRRGLAAFPCIRIVGIDNMSFASMLHRKIIEERPEAVFIDAGRGEGVIDRLRQLNSPSAIIEVPFGGQALDHTVNGYANRRAEMWDNMRKWLQSGGSIPNDYELTKELAAPTYTYDGQSRLKLERKEEIRERVGFSPDRADALALTFAEPVVSSRDEDFPEFVGQAFCNDNYIWNWGA